MAEQFLNAAQVSTPLEQVRGGGVAQAVRAQVRCIWHSPKPAVDDVSGSPSSESAPSDADEEGVATLGPYQRRSADSKPVGDRLSCRLPVGHAALLSTLAHDSHDAVGFVEVRHVEPDQLPHSDSRRIQQLQQSAIRTRPPFGLASARPGSARSSPCLFAHAVNVRAADARRATVARDRPCVR
jgi:hypothetical protein